jgi:hypothetical protein
MKLVSAAGKPCTPPGAVAADPPTPVPYRGPVSAYSPKGWSAGAGVRETANDLRRATWELVSRHTDLA